MSTIFKELSRSVSKAEIERIASDLNIKLPQSFMDHYSKYNGGYPENRHYRWDDGDVTRIDHFFSMKYKGFTQFEEAYNDLFIVEQVLPLGYVPFAVDDGGNFFCICTSDDCFDSVFYAAMYHYNAAEPSEYLTKISSSFYAFLEGLENK